MIDVHVLLYVAQNRLKRGNRIPPHKKIKTYLLMCYNYSTVREYDIRDTYTQSEGTSSRFQLAISIGYSASVGRVRRVRVRKQALRHSFSHDL